MKRIILLFVLIGFSTIGYSQKILTAFSYKQELFNDNGEKMEVNYKNISITSGVTKDRRKIIKFEEGNSKPPQCYTLVPVRKFIKNGHLIHLNKALEGGYIYYIMDKKTITHIMSEEKGYGKILFYIDGYSSKKGFMPSILP